MQHVKLELILNHRPMGYSKNMGNSVLAATLRTAAALCLALVLAIGANVSQPSRARVKVPRKGPRFRRALSHRISHDVSSKLMMPHHG
jgi:hypothetical protein